MLKDILAEWNKQGLHQRAREEAKQAVRELASGNLLPNLEVAQEVIDLVVDMGGYSGVTPLKVRIPVFPDEI